VRVRQAMRWATLSHAFLGQESRCTVGNGEPFGYLGRRRERGELDTAEVDETLRSIRRSLSGSAGVPVGVVMP
jgi:hypothetical protein